MLWNNDILFLHPQKTAGMAVTSALLAGLRGPIFISLPHGHWPKGRFPGVAFVDGVRHENMAEARSKLAEFNRYLSDFRSIIVVARNPYDIEVSRYFHLRKPEAFERTAERDLACSSSFDDFVLRNEIKDAGVSGYFEMDGRRPDALRVIRFERLQADLDEALAEIGVAPIKVGVNNVSSEREGRPYKDFYASAEVKTAVERRYRWFFVSGLYPRMDADVPPSFDADMIAVNEGRAAPAV